MTIQITIKNPTRLHDDTITIYVESHMSLGDLKAKLQAEYPDHPAPEAITLIYAGKVLKDESALLASFLPTDANAVVLHIVVKAATTTQPPRPASLAADTSTRETHRVAEPHPPAPLSQPPAPAMNAAATAAAEGTATIGSTETTANDGSRVSSAEGSSIPSAFYVPVAPAVQQPQANLYGPAYAAAYQAALAALVGQAGGSNGSSSQAGAPQHMMHNIPHPQAYAFVPTMVPMPQPVLPFYMHGQQQQGDDQQQQQQGMRRQVFMQMPMMHMPYGYPMPPHMELRQRHQHQHPDAATGAAPPPPPAPPPVGPLNPNLVAMLRAFQEHGAVLPPHLAEAVRQAEVRPAARPAPRRRIQFRVRINVRALLQLAVMLVVVYQHCPPQRFIMLCALGAVLFLSTTPRVRALLQRLTGWQQRNQEGADLAAARQAVAAAGAPAGAPPAAAAAAAGGAVHQGEGQQPAAGGIPDAAGFAANPDAANPAPRPGGVLHEIHAFITGFITSLLPALDRDAAGVQNGDMQDVF